MRFLPAQGKLARYRAVLAGKNGLLSIVVLGIYTAAMASSNAVCVRHCQAWMSPCGRVHTSIAFVYNNNIRVQLEYNIGKHSRSRVVSACMHPHM